VYGQREKRRIQDAVVFGTDLYHRDPAFGLEIWALETKKLVVIVAFRPLFLGSMIKPL